MDHRDNYLAACTDSMETSATTSGRASPSSLSESTSITEDCLQTPVSWDKFYEKPNFELPNVNLTQLIDMEPETLAKLNENLALLSPMEILRWIVELIPSLGNVVQFTSFGVSGMIITHIMALIGANVPVLFVNTLYHFEEVSHSHFGWALTTLALDVGIEEYSGGTIQP